MLKRSRLTNVSTAAIMAIVAMLAVVADHMPAEAKTKQQCYSEARACRQSCNSTTNTNPQRGPTRQSCIIRCEKAAFRCTQNLPIDRPPPQAVSRATTTSPKVAPITRVAARPHIRVPTGGPMHPMTPMRGGGRR